MGDRRRFVRVHTPSGPRWAEVTTDDEVLAISGSPFSGGATTDESLGPLRDCRLLAPVTPSKIVCVARNYVAHALELEHDVPTEPMIFLKPPSAVIGPEDVIELPRLSQRVDWEAELAIVIGRRCRQVAESDASDVIFGVTCANDVTARDLQRSDARWTRGKGFDTFCPIGPWIVTGVEPAAVADLQITCRVNGEVRQDARTSLMIFSPPVLISWITSVMTLEPGDVVLTGTPAGIGPMADGDRVEVEIASIGILRNSARRETV